MNILSYIHVHRLPSPTGVGRVIDQLLRCHIEQFEHRHRILVEARVYDRMYQQLRDYWRCVSFIPYYKNTFFQQAKWVLQNRPQAEEYWPDVDVVYCPAESYVSTRQARLVCTIHDVAGFELDLYQKTWSKQWQNFKWEYLFKRMAEHADAVVTVSEFSASRIAHFFPRLAPKLHVIHNAPHPVFGSNSSPDLEDEVKLLSGGKPYVLMPGGLSLRKNADLILKTVPILARELPGIKLIVAGSNDPSFLIRLNAIEKKNVMLPGYVSDELLNALYQHAAVVWFPSRYEGFGMPVIEAMAAGAPVVASRTSSIPEVVGDAALLCDMDDSMEHVEAIRSLIGSSQFRREMCERSNEQAKKFTWASSAQQLEKLFQSL